jgi:hypothetical protein
LLDGLARVPYDVFWLSPFRELEKMIESRNSVESHG